MRPLPVLFLSLATALLLCLVASSWIGGLPGALSPVVAQEEPEQKKKKLRYVGAKRCKGCHNEDEQDPEAAITLQEYSVWEQMDKHARAYKVLSEPRSQRMGEILGFDVTKDPRCLNCHSMAWLPEDQKTRHVKIEEGVTCDGCHGPSEAWLGPHTFDDWKEKSVAEKEELGMYDIFSPFTRAEMCVSCHSGNVKEGKILEHSFYAAGHPPLPGIELDLFCEEMPPHWIYDNWKKRLEKSGELTRVQMTLVGALAVVDEYMSLLEQVSQTDKWPDYAFFDCYSCHHDLRVVSWRRERGYEGATPGHVQPRFWILPLAGLAAELAGEAEGWKAQRAQLQDAFDAGPLGDAGKIAAAAKAVSAWSAETARKLQAKKFDPAYCQDVLRRLCAIDVTRLDFDSARQVAWAIKSTHGQLSELGYKSKDDARVTAILSELDATLRLELPSGQSGEIMESLPGNLEAMAEYEESRELAPGPARFKKSLDELGQLFAAE